LLKAGDITNYIKIKDRADEIERDFRSLFQRRFEKIASLSIYDLDSELMSSLTPEEKEFITKLHNIMLDEYNLLLRKVPESPVRSSEVKSALEKTPEPEQKTVVTAKNDSQSEPVGVPQTTKEYLLVRILGDQPPIAQPDGDYFLHDQDVIYLDKKFAELLIKRNAAKKIEIK
ncbi:MAG TPA: hypothetical protein VKU79_06110, partial [Thermoplasmataceae archaeon]|nr:hypothetical protein [Thermoplasmataceae archaeon]